MHKAFPPYEGLNGRDIKVFTQLFLLYQSVYQDNDCHTTSQYTQYLPTPQKRGGNVVIPV